MEEKLLLRHLKAISIDFLNAGKNNEDIRVDFKPDNIIVDPYTLEMTIVDPYWLITTKSDEILRLTPLDDDYAQRSFASLQGWRLIT